MPGVSGKWFLFELIWSIGEVLTSTRQGYRVPARTGFVVERDAGYKVPARTGYTAKRSGRWG